MYFKIIDDIFCVKKLICYPSQKLAENEIDIFPWTGIIFDVRPVLSCHVEMVVQLSLK